jgi:hypothetical protein
MERRKFFSLAPLGLVGIAALAKGETPTEATKSVTKKAMSLTIVGPDGEEYHPLVVEKDDSTYEEVQMPKMVTTYEFSNERFRVSSNGLGVGTSAPAPEVKFFTHAVEKFRL